MAGVCVLYIEAGSGSGGSSASLVRLLKQLNGFVEPHLLVNQRGCFIQQLEANGTNVEEFAIRRRQHLDSDISKNDRSGGLWQNIFTLHSPLFFEVIRQIRMWKPNIVHVNNDPRVGLAAILAAKWCGIPVVCHLRTARLLDRLELHMIRWIDTLIVISRVSEQTCLKQGISSSKIVRIPDGMDFNDFQNEYNRKTAKKRLNLPSNVPTIGVVSRLIPGKGHEIFFQALRLVVDRMPEVRAVVVGDECEERSEYPQQLKNLVTGLDLNQHVLFTGWREDVSELYAAFDVLVQSSTLTEGLPGVCLEAMAQRLPVVSTSIGGATELVRDAVTGRLVPPGDPGAMATALLDLLNDSERMRVMGEVGYQLVMKEYHIQSTAKAVESVYRALTAQRNR